MHRRPSIRAAFLGLALGTTLFAQSGRDDGPPARNGHAMATAGPRGGILMLGSEGAPETLWTLDAAGWRRLAEPGPAARSMPAAAFDSRRGVFVLFGGVGLRSGSRFGDTWEWSGRGWQERDVPGPGARDHHAMAYDAARGQAVMFGGWNTERTFPADTWTWDGESWKRAATDGPGGIGHHAMAYDSRRQRVVLFGGEGPGRPADENVWEWDGARWERLAVPGAGPGARTRHRLAYDAHRGVTVLFGGQIGSGRTATYPADTWTWDGRGWTRQDAPGPSARWMHAMAFDEARGRVVLFGGSLGGPPYRALADTWEWDGERWIEIRRGGAQPSPE